MSGPTPAFRLTLTGSTQPISSSKILTQGFCIRNNTGNDLVWYGDSTLTSGQGMYIKADECNEKVARPTSRGTLYLFDLSKIYIVGTAGQYVYVEYLRDE